jgi:hypothetical protein
VDKLINTHIDDVEEIERQLDIVIEQEVSQVDMDAILRSPQEELARVAENIKRIFLDQYADKAVELGFDLGRKINEKIGQDKTIKVDDSDNPKLNDTGADSKQD